MRASRTWAYRVVACVGVALVVAGCSLLPGVYSPRSPSDEKNFGQSEGRACVKNGNPWLHFVCEGHPPRDFSDGLADPEVIRWLEKLKWEKASLPFDREPASGSVKPKMRIQSIRDPQRFRFADHNDTAYVMARIVASPRAPMDRRYSIGGDPNSTLDDNFYIVVRGFIPDDKTPSNGPVEAGQSRPISRWTIYGIDRAGNAPRLKEISSGTVRWCLHPHKKLQRDRQASFAYCNPTLSVQRFAADQPEFGPPAWFTCGIGCCVADFS